MEIEANFLLRELKEQLKKRKYKYVINKVEKILDKEENYAGYTEEAMLKLLTVESYAVLKLLERNITKKYKYCRELAMSLIDLLSRNVAKCHSLLLIDLQNMTIFDSYPLYLQSKASTRPYRHHSNAWSRSQTQEMEQQERRDKLKKEMEQFWKIVMMASILVSSTYQTYEHPNQSFIQEMGQLALKIVPMRFKIMENRVLQIEFLMNYSKMLSLTNHQQQSEEYLSYSLDLLFDLIHSLNLILHSVMSVKHHQASRHRKTAFKLLVICLLSSNRNKMGMPGRQIGAGYGVRVVEGLLQGLESLSSWKKMIAPQLYLQDQFLKYLVEKEELSAIIGPAFQTQLEYLLLSQTASPKSHPILQFFNKKMADLQAHQQKQNMKIAQKYKNSLKDDAKPKEKIQRICKEFKQSKDSKKADLNRKLLQKIIYNYSEQGETHQQGQSSQKPSAQVPSNQQAHLRKIQSKSKFFQQRSSHLVGSSFTLIIKNSPIQRSTQTSISTSRCFIGKESRRQLQKYVENDRILSNKIQMLKRTAKRVKAPISQESQQEITDAHLRLSVKLQAEQIFKTKNNRNSEDKPEEQPINQLSPRISPKVNQLTTKSKSEIFLDILLKNRKYLGIRKISEKLETLKKREQQSMKLKSVRLNSMSMTRSKSSQWKFQTLTRTILQNHLQETSESNPDDLQYSGFPMKRQKLLMSSHLLGQKSIELIKCKLQRKIHRQVTSGDLAIKRTAKIKKKPVMVSLR